MHYLFIDSTILCRCKPHFWNTKCDSNFERCIKSKFHLHLEAIILRDNKCENIYRFHYACTLQCNGLKHQNATMQSDSEIFCYHMQSYASAFFYNLQVTEILYSSCGIAKKLYSEYLTHCMDEVGSSNQFVLNIWTLNN